MQYNTCLIRFLTLSSILLLVGCSSPRQHMSEITASKFVSKPSQGKSLVIFARADSWGLGGQMQGGVFDGEKYIGSIPEAVHFSYETEPGEHMFMLIAERASLMKANLAPNKTYHAIIEARSGGWRAAYVFVPVNDDKTEAKFKEILANSKPVATNNEGKQWAQKSKNSIASKRAHALSNWERMPDSKKAILKIESGY